LSQKHLTLPKVQRGQIDQHSGPRPHERRINRVERLLQDREGSLRLPHDHKAVALPPNQVRMVEVGQSARPAAWLYLLERLVGLVEGTEGVFRVSGDG
jgi:hypothetical protein